MFLAASTHLFLLFDGSAYDGSLFVLAPNIFFFWRTRVISASDVMPRMCTYLTDFLYAVIVVVGKYARHVLYCV